MTPLEQLKDIHIPQQVSLWPPAYGWWLLALLIIITIAVITVVVLKRRRFYAPKREALTLLAKISSDQKDWPVRMNTLLKRVCLHYFSQKQLAKLHSAQWQTFLADQLPNSKQTAFNTAFSALQAQLYRPDAPKADDFEHIQTQMTMWLKNTKFTTKQGLSTAGAAHV
jgi:hypothetical protein